MAVYGIDIGVRSFTYARLDGDDLTVGCYHADVGTRHRELRDLAANFVLKPQSGDTVYIEEPPLAGSKNIRTGLKLAHTAGALLANCRVPAYLVPVSSWKKATVGHGNASKSDVAAWLKGVFPEYADRCGTDQNKFDATAIALYGRDVQDDLYGEVADREYGYRLNRG